MRGDARYGAEEHFQNEANQALRLAHFLSSFLQVRNRLRAHVAAFFLCRGLRGTFVRHKDGDNVG